MAPHEILEFVRRQPFEPFRVCLTDGQSYDILHPELCMPGKRSVIIGLVTDPSDPLYDRTVWVDPLHVVRLEPLPTTPSNSQSGNGPAPPPGT